MGKWYCIQKYYDSGKVAATVTQEKPVRPVDGENTKFDLYVDEFDTKAEADEFKKKALKA